MKKGRKFWIEILFPPALILAAGFAVYANSLEGEFILDDLVAIKFNSTIRHLSPLQKILFPAKELLLVEGNTVQGRPLLNLSFALNYAAARLAVWGYHAVNIAIHLISGLLLYGVIRRTLLLPRFKGRMGDAATWLALAVALVWLIHPLQTESVTYLAQRAESMSGMFYLLTMYLAIRGFAARRPFRWRIGAVIACVLGAATKEVLVTAPIMVLLFDGLIVAPTWREVWRQRWRFHLSMALCGWGALAAFMIGAQGSNLGNVTSLLLQLEGSKEGISYGHEIHWIDYARIQLWAVAHYLRLGLWPAPLILTYGTDVAEDFWSVFCSALVLAILLAVTLLALSRRRATGLAAAWIFVILLPTSSVFPLSGQTVAEHRMYLPLAGLVTLVLIGGFDLLHRVLERQVRDEHRRRAWVWGVFALVVLPVLALFGALTAFRNENYRTSVSIWRDTACKLPTNSGAHSNLAAALFHRGKFEEAIVEGKWALDLNPDNPDALYNVGLSLVEAGHMEEAMHYFAKLAKLSPTAAQAYNGAGMGFLRAEQYEKAIQAFEAAVKIQPAFSDAHNNLGVALSHLDRLDEAIAHYEKALELEVHAADLINALGSGLHPHDDPDELTGFMKSGVETQSGFAEVHYNLGSALLRSNQTEAAMEHFRIALEISPRHAAAHNNLGSACLKLGLVREAVQHYEAAVSINPREMGALNNLAWVLATSPNETLRNGAKALDLARRANELSGGSNPLILRTLAAAFAEAGHFSDAAKVAEDAVTLATSRGDEALTQALNAQRHFYLEGKPMRDFPSSSAPP